MGNAHEGSCRICGSFGPLTFEHIPPRSAYNVDQRLFATVQSRLQGISYRRFRQGIGAYCLCQKCNNTTGAYYGGAFVDWSRQGMEYLEKLEHRSGIQLLFHIKPLNVIKQIAVMALAASQTIHPVYTRELRVFVLDKHLNHLDPNIRFHVYFNAGGIPRFESGMVVMKVGEGGSFVEAEVALPPFGYCITTPLGNNRCLASGQGLCDITWFAGFPYNIWTTIAIRPPLLETNEPFPLDYRTKQEIGNLP